MAWNEALRPGDRSEAAAAAAPNPFGFSATPRLALVCAALLAGIFLATVALPLATYTTVLALFGLAHVGSELRYIDYRFGPRLRGGFGAWIALSLALAVLARLSSMLGLLPPAIAVALEVSIGAAMTSVCVACMRSCRPVGVIVALVLFSGAVIAPFETLLFLAIAHNLTPLAFLADALAGSLRRRVLLILTVPFVVLPLLIATGLPFELLASLGLVAPDASLLSSGGIGANLGAYVPAQLISSDWALHIFSAAVFAQCMHYAIVIFILPRLIDPDAWRSRPLVHWPSARRFALYLAAAALLLALGFTVNFKVARQIYALAAMVHSWIEIPILVLALDRGASGAQARLSA